MFYDKYLNQKIIWKYHNQFEFEEENRFLKI